MKTHKSTLRQNKKPSVCTSHVEQPCRFLNTTGESTTPPVVFASSQQQEDQKQQKSFIEFEDNANVTFRTFDSNSDHGNSLSFRCRSISPTVTSGYGVWLPRTRTYKKTASAKSASSAGTGFSGFLLRFFGVLKVAFATLTSFSGKSQKRTLQLRRVA